MRYSVIVPILTILNFSFAQDCNCPNYGGEIAQLNDSTEKLLAELTAEKQRAKQLEGRVADLEAMVKLLLDANPGVRANILQKLEDDRKAREAAAKQAEQKEAEEKAARRQRALDLFSKALLIASVLDDGSEITMQEGSVVVVPVSVRATAKKWKKGDELSLDGKGLAQNTWKILNKRTQETFLINDCPWIDRLSSLHSIIKE
ncbi:MAG: hypothetical protein KIS92_05375 [Planctomycetota bacterium]|nr:hypothetical protein [Planctomycetota bacterium]